MAPGRGPPRMQYLLLVGGVRLLGMRSESHGVFGAWSGVRRILVSGSYLLIQSMADEWCVIPRRGFRSPAAFKCFAAEARQLRAEARRGVSSAA